MTLNRDNIGYNVESPIRQSKGQIHGERDRIMLKGAIKTTKTKGWVHGVMDSFTGTFKDIKRAATGKRRN
jgi:hypothetical protein